MCNAMTLGSIDAIPLNSGVRSRARLTVRRRITLNAISTVVRIDTYTRPQLILVLTLILTLIPDILTICRPDPDACTRNDS
jgi:hypothetical protein